VPAPAVADEGAVGPGLGHGLIVGEGKPEGRDVARKRIVGLYGDLDQIRARRVDAFVDVLAEIAPGPTVEAAVLYRGQIVGHKVRAEFVALVDDGPELTGLRVDVQSVRIAQPRSEDAGHAGFTVDLPDRGA